MNAKTALALVALLAVGAACSDQPVSRSGAAADPAALQAVWGQNAGSVGGDVMTALLEVSDEAAVAVHADDADRSTAPEDDELAAVQSLMDGKGDLTIVRVGVVQLLGADSLAPLTAPFVVTNNAQAQAIADDAAIRDTVFADLGGMGLVGLALVPGGLRHPFAYGDEPLLGADDYAGQVVNVRRDAGVETMLDALGATPDHSVDSARFNAVQRGALRGIEVQVQQLAAVTLPAVQTANVTLYSKYDVVLVRQAAWDGLSAGQREALRATVATAAATAVAARPSETQGQALWCHQTGTATVLASDRELASLHAALDPLTQALDQGVVGRMRALHDGTSDPEPFTCKGPAPTEPLSAFLVDPKGDQRQFDGTWRVSATPQELMSRGVSTNDAYANAGVWEFRLENGYADGIQPDGRPCNWHYAINGREFSVDWGVDGIDDCNGVMRGRWRMEGDRLYLMVQKEMEYDVLLDQAMFDQGMVRVE